METHCDYQDEAIVRLSKDQRYLTYLYESYLCSNKQEDLDRLKQMLYCHMYYQNICNV